MMHVVLGSSRQDADIEDHFTLPVVVATPTSFCTHDNRMLLETKKSDIRSFIPSPLAVFPNRSQMSETNKINTVTSGTYCPTFSVNEPSAVLSHFRMALDEMPSAASCW